MLSISFEPSGIRFWEVSLIFHIRALGRVSLCIFCLICIFSGTLSDVRGDSLETGTPEFASMPGATIDSISTDQFHLRPGPPKGSDTTGVAKLDQIVVTANRRQRLLEASQSLSVIKPSEWIGTNKTLADVVAEQTGVQTRRYGGTGSFQVEIDVATGTVVATLPGVKDAFGGICYDDVEGKLYVGERDATEMGIRVFKDNVQVGSTIKTLNSLPSTGMAIVR